MREPGDRAPKVLSSGEPTPSFPAEGHGTEPKRVDVDRSLPSGSESTARAHMLPGREPGDLGEASPCVVQGRQPEEGEEPQSLVSSAEESDAGMVPRKSAKTRVTPVESMEGRAAAKGKSASGNALRAQDRQGAPTQVERIGQRAKEKKGERFDNLLSAIQAPLLKEAYQRLRKRAAPGVDGITWEEYGEHLDARSDIYSLAVIAYQMLAGKTPFDGDFKTVMESHKETAPPPLEVKKVPKKVKRMIMSALAKNPAVL